MTLRIGYITRTYLQQGSQALTAISNKRAVKFYAMKEALLTVVSIIVAGSAVVSKKTAKFIIKLIQRDCSQQVQAEKLWLNDATGARDYTNRAKSYKVNGDEYMAAAKWCSKW